MKTTYHTIGRFITIDFHNGKYFYETDRDEFGYLPAKSFSDAVEQIENHLRVKPQTTESTEDIPGVVDNIEDLWNDKS